MKMCRHFVANRCSRGGTCTFAHSYLELHIDPSMQEFDGGFYFARSGEWRQR